MFSSYLKECCVILYIFISLVIIISVCLPVCLAILFYGIYLSYPFLDIISIKTSSIRFVSFFSPLCHSLASQQSITVPSFLHVIILLGL